MAFSKLSTRTGMFALLLGVIVLSLFGSLVAADRALARADRETVDRDAHLIAVVAERELRLRAEALSQLFAPLLPGARPAEPDAAPAGLAGVWVIDKTRRPVWRELSDSSLSLEDSILARAAAARGRARLSLTGTGHGVLLAVPLEHRGV